MGNPVYRFYWHHLQMSWLKIRQWILKSWAQGRAKTLLLHPTPKAGVEPRDFHMLSKCSVVEMHTHTRAHTHTLTHTQKDTHQPLFGGL